MEWITYVSKYRYCNYLKIKSKICKQFIAQRHRYDDDTIYKLED